jgi:hypothetical protein
MKVSELIGSEDCIGPISYAPRGIKPVGICINQETGKKFAIFEVEERKNRVSTFLKRIKGYKGTHYLSRIKKNPFSLESLGFLSMLGIDIEEKSSMLAFAVGAYAYRMLGENESHRSFSEALYMMESSGRDEVREGSIRVITGARSPEYRAKQIARVINIMESKKIGFNIQMLIEDLLYKDNKSLSESWVGGFFGCIFNEED